MAPASIKPAQNYEWVLEKAPAESKKNFAKDRKRGTQKAREQRKDQKRAQKEAQKRQKTAQAGAASSGGVAVLKPPNGRLSRALRELQRQGHAMANLLEDDLLIENYNARHQPQIDLSPSGSSSKAGPGINSVPLVGNTPASVAMQRTDAHAAHQAMIPPEFPGQSFSGPQAVWPLGPDPNGVSHTVPDAHAAHQAMIPPAFPGQSFSGPQAVWPLGPDPNGVSHTVPDAHAAHQAMIPPAFPGQSFSGPQAVWPLGPDPNGVSHTVPVPEGLPALFADRQGRCFFILRHRKVWIYRRDSQEHYMAWDSPHLLPPQYQRRFVNTTPLDSYEAGMITRPQIEFTESWNMAPYNRLYASADGHLFFRVLGGKEWLIEHDGSRKLVQLPPRRLSDAATFDGVPIDFSGDLDRADLVYAHNGGSPGWFPGAALDLPDAPTFGPPAGYNEPGTV